MIKAMLEALRRRHERDEEAGFTLIELMVVVLIIAILIAIAIPTFLGAQDRARDRGAQSDLRNALTAAKTIATDFEGAFKSTTSAAIDDAALNSVEGALDYTGSDAKDYVHHTVSTDFDEIILITQSNSGKWFAIWADKRGETKYCKTSDSTLTLATWEGYADDTDGFSTGATQCADKW